MTFHHERRFFDTTDFIVFSIIMIIPILIGIYYTFISKRKPKTISEYLVGNRNMKLFPVSMSLAASSISGYLLVGPISEVYFYGIEYIFESVGSIISNYCFVMLYLPVFYNLKITSTFEYLQIRFDYKVRLLGSLLFLIKTTLTMALWIYAPVLMFEQVIGVNLNILTPIFSGICVFYTFGGVRSVIWADTFQMIIMLLGMIVIVIVGVNEVGEVENIWEINKQGERLLVDFNLDPRLRQSFWMLVVGKSFHILGYNISSQFIVQRCVSVSTLSRSKVAVAIEVITSVAITFLSCYIGLMLYAAFHDCDPISAQKISKPDQLLPYFIMNLKNRIPALPSVVISVVFCAGLSSVCSGLNSMSGVLLIDFIRPISKNSITDARGTVYMKIIAVAIGVLSTGVIYTLNNSNNLVQTTISLTAITMGTSLGIFTLGVLLPWANAIGALIGGIAGGVIVAWMSIGSQIASAAKKSAYTTLPLSIENCDNSTMINFVNKTMEIGSEDMEEPFFLYTISFHYYSMIGALTSIIVGMIVSYFTGFNKPRDVNPRLLSPALQKYFKRDEAACEMTNMATD